MTNCLGRGDGSPLKATGLPYERAGDSTEIVCTEGSPAQTEIVWRSVRARGLNSMYFAVLTAMPKQIFIPLSDDLVFDRPDLINGPVVAYSPGMICGEWLDIEINPDDGTCDNGQQEE